LRLRNFRLLIAGQMVSTIGDMFYAVALPWFVLSSGGTPSDLGIVLAAYGIPRAGFVLLGGALSDRLQPRRLMLLADIARALLVGGLAAIVAPRHAYALDTLRHRRAAGRIRGAFHSCLNGDAAQYHVR
jgi:MFS family permease